MTAHSALCCLIQTNVNAERGAVQAVLIILWGGRCRADVDVIYPQFYLR